MASFATLLTDEGQYVTWRNAMIDIFLLRQPGMIREALCSFVDAFRAAFHGRNDRNHDATSSNLLIFRLYPGVQRVAWSTFFTQWLELWKHDADLPRVHIAVGSHKTEADQLACTNRVHTFLATTSSKNLSIVWMDHAPWPVVRHALEQATTDRKVWYVWGTHLSFSPRTPLHQIASLLAPTCPDVFLRARPCIVAFVEEPEEDTPTIISVERGPDKLPKDLLCHLLQWVDATSGLTLGRVCRSWYQIFKDESAWRSTRSVAPQRCISFRQAMRILPRSLVSVGPSFEFVWIQEEEEEYNERWVDTIFALLDLPAWRGITFDFTDWHRAYDNHGQVQASSGNSLHEHLQTWLDGTPIERIQSLHLHGHTIYEEDWGCVPIPSDMNSVGWLSSRDMENAIYFFPRIATLSLMIESIDDDNDKIAGGESCICLASTRLPNLTSLRLYSDPSYAKYGSSRSSDIARLSLTDLHHIHACTTIVSLSLNVPLDVPLDVFGAYEKPQALSTLLWTQLLASPLVHSGNLRHLSLWNEATCCSRSPFVFCDDDDDTDASRVKHVGVAHLAPSITLCHTQLQYHPSHVDCMARLGIAQKE
jgi:hypothetical protein